MLTLNADQAQPAPGLTTYQRTHRAPPPSKQDAATWMVGMRGQQVTPRVSAKHWEVSWELMRSYFIPQLSLHQLKRVEIGGFQNGWFLILDVRPATR